MKSFKEIKKLVKKPGLMQEAKEIEESIKFSREALAYNKVLACVIVSMAKMLQKHNETEVVYIVNGEEKTTNLEEIDKDLKELTIQGYL